MSIEANSVVPEIARASGETMMRFTPRRFAIWVSLGLICLGGFASLLLLRGFDSQLDDVTKTLAMRSAASQLSQSLSEAEANQRGYLLTGHEQFYEAYLEAIDGTQGRVLNLLDMSKGDNSQHSRLISITGTISGKLAEMERVVGLARSDNGVQARNILETGLGARLMAEVTGTLSDFVAEEDGKLAGRNAEINSIRTLLAFAMIGAVIASAVLAYALLARSERRVSQLKTTQAGLQTQNQLLEYEVAARTKVIEEAREHAERERERVETLLQDMNHRIGNSLSTVSSLLALQALRSNQDNVKSALEAARVRVHAIASAHRRLRLGSDLETTSAAEFLTAVVEDIGATQLNNSRVKLSAEIEPIEVAARDATSLGILVAELITNALKHAFPNNRTGEVCVHLYSSASGVPTLDVSDNGAGLLVSDGDEGLGSVIVKQLSTQFGGEPSYMAREEGGVLVRINLPLLGKVYPEPEN